MRELQLLCCETEGGEYRLVGDAFVSRVFQRQPGSLRPLDVSQDPCADLWSGSTGWQSSSGEDFRMYFAVHGLPRCECPHVMFSGFEFDFKGRTDHKLDSVGAWVQPWSFDIENGSFRMVVGGGFRDRNYNNPYNWKVYFQIWNPR